MKKILATAVVFLSASILSADISVTDRSATLRSLTQSDNQAKRETKKAHRHGLQMGAVSSGRLHPHATGTGDITLVDAAGLQYMIDTNITAFGPFSSGSSASAGASEASYAAPVVASTLNGGTTTSALDDMFDGYNSLCVSLTNAPGPCVVGNPAYAFYYQTGAAPVFDATVPTGPTCTNRQLVFPAKTIGALSVQRKVFVPTNDTFIRWMNFFTNTSGAPVTFTMTTANNLGSDNNTVITGSSSGDNAAQVTDTWVATFQNFSGTTSSDPRIGHVLQGTGALTPVSNIFFADGNDQPFWTYAITLAPGQTKAILNFATGSGTKAAAAAKAAALALLPANSTQCLSTTELGQITNFAISTDLSITKSTTAPNAFGGNPITYTLAVSNAGPSPANAVSVSDTLPAGSTFVSASGTGWACNNVAGVVTCTVATLPLGAAPVINLTIIAPPVVAAGTLSNTATVSSSTTDTNPANNTSTSSVPIFPGSQIPAFSTWTLMLLAAMLAVIALARRT
ncbi:MAG TPA: DUF11 domain-containing protein [Thermoanaerobaculia bacterium]|nr:DUF11 domain-containing protein [Thermoanaerobaculia bacterium]